MYSKVVWFFIFFKTRLQNNSYKNMAIFVVFGWMAKIARGGRDLTPIASACI